jgi:hypothetical protein
MGVLQVEKPKRIKVGNGPCVTSIVGPDGDAQLYRR